MRKALIIILSLLTANVLSAQVEKTQKPNIIIIYTDDQGSGDVSALNPGAKFRVLSHLFKEKVLSIKIMIIRNHRTLVFN